MDFALVLADNKVGDIGLGIILIVIIAAAFYGIFFYTPR